MICRWIGALFQRLSDILSYKEPTYGRSYVENWTMFIFMHISWPDLCCLRCDVYTGSIFIFVLCFFTFAKSTGTCLWYYWPLKMAVWLPESLLCWPAIVGMSRLLFFYVFLVTSTFYLAISKICEQDLTRHRFTEHFIEAKRANGGLQAPSLSICTTYDTTRIKRTVLSSLLTSNIQLSSVQFAIVSPTKLAFLCEVSVNRVSARYFHWLPSRYFSTSCSTYPLKSSISWENAIRLTFQSIIVCWVLGDFHFSQSVSSTDNRTKCGDDFLIALTWHSVCDQLIYKSRT